jgi:hypothetical protein
LVVQNDFGNRHGLGVDDLKALFAELVDENVGVLRGQVEHTD